MRISESRSELAIARWDSNGECHCLRTLATKSAGSNAMPGEVRQSNGGATSRQAVVESCQIWSTKSDTD